MNFLTRTLAESDGNPSTMRLATILVALTIMGGWLYVTVKTTTLQPFTWEQCSMVLGALGIKAWQRGKEGKESSGTGVPPVSPQ